MIGTGLLMVIARFSTIKALSVAFINLMMILAFYWVVFFETEHPIQYFVAKPHWVLLLVVALPGSVWLGWRAAMIFAQVVRHGGAAIWTEGPELIFTSRRVFCAPLEAIAEISAGTYPYGGLRFETITLRLKNGRSKVISTALLSPERQKIIADLRAAAG